MAKIKFDPEKDIPDLSGKVILVTGGTNPSVYTPFLTMANRSIKEMLASGRLRLSP